MRLTMSEKTNAKLEIGLLPQCPVEGLYVHIPFCFHKCHYCDFYSITRQTPERMSRFVELILKEAREWAGTRQIRPRTVFFGGGTPSLLPITQMRGLIAGLQQTFDLTDVEEWTVECNPATVTEDYCRMLRDSGADRLSFGAQSFDRSELAILERHHEPAQVAESIALARKAGFQRLNIDLIYAIPGQSMESWRRSLEAALELSLTHYSCYGITYEPNTAMAVRKRLGQFQAATDELELGMMREARHALSRHGLEAYEISNYATPGEECRHNLVYWTGGNYIGLGPSASSHLAGHRFKNKPHLGDWERGVAGGQLPVFDHEVLTPAHRAGELVMLMLRLKGGIDYAEFSRRTGFDAREMYEEILNRLTGMSLIARDERGFRLKESGIDVADAVAREFLLATPE